MSATATTTLQPIPYLAFDGNCAEAMRYYEKVLGGKITVMMTNGQSPAAEHFPKEFHDKIMHARLELPGGGLLYGGDSCTPTPYEGIKGVTLALNYDTVEEAESVFDTLSKAGKVTMPFSDTFWAKKFGMLVDKYGVSWIINGELQPM